MAISKVKGSAIQDATIPEDKLEDEAGSFRMILDGSDGSATDAGDFLLLDATASSTNVGEQFLFEPATDDGSAVLSSSKSIIFDGNAQDYHIGIDDSTDKLTIGKVSASGTASALLIDSESVMTNPAKPAFRMRGTNAAYVTTTPVVFAATDYDQSGSSGGVDLGNNRYEIPTAGLWHFALNLGIVRTTSAGNCYPNIQRIRGGSAVGNGYAYFAPGSGSVTHYGSCHLELIIECLVGDYINVVFAHTNGAYYNGPNECRFEGHLLG
jgi:hypothetical protein